MYDQDFVENVLVILTKHTLDEFLQQRNPADLIALYTFYYYTAKWQKTNQPCCTTDYVSKGLKWGIQKVQARKKQLIKMGVIEDVDKRDENGKITGHYIKLNYILKQETTQALSHGVESSTGGEISPKCLKSSNINALSSDNKIHRKFVPPSVEEVKAYCTERNNGISAETFVDFYSSKGWVVGKSPMKDWKACVRTWERNHPNNKAFDDEQFERTFGSGFTVINNDE